MAKKPKIGTVKRRCDKLFSEYIRKRDVKYYQDQYPELNEGYVKCCSCGKIDHWKNMDAGHFISRKRNSTRFHVHNCHIQCQRCNRYDGGNPAGYALFIVQEYGEAALSELTELSRQNKQYRLSDLLELEKQIKEWIKELR